MKLNDELLVIRQKCDKLISDLQAVHALGVRHVIGPDFWKLSFEELHRTSVNTSEIIDDIRARIFIKSIQLHRLTILSNAKRFLSNLRMVGQMLSGNTKGLSLHDRPVIWDSLFCGSCCFHNFSFI